MDPGLPRCGNCQARTRNMGVRIPCTDAVLRFADWPAMITHTGATLHSAKSRRNLQALQPLYRVRHPAACRVDTIRKSPCHLLEGREDRAVLQHRRPALEPALRSSLVIC